MSEYMENYSDLINSIDEIAILLDNKGNILTANNSFYQSMQKFYRNFDDLTGENVFDLFPPEISIKRKKIFDKIVKGRKKLTCRERLYNDIPVEVTFKPIFNGFGSVEKVCAFSKEITSDKMESETKPIDYKNFFDEMICGFAYHKIILDKDDKPVDYLFLDINPKFEQLLQRSRDEVVGKTVLELLPETEPYWIETYGDVALTGNPIKYSNYSKEFDKYFEVYAFSPEKYYFAVTFNDVTEAKKTELNLETTISKYRNVFEHAPIGIFRSTPEGRFLEVNQTLAEMLGYDTPDEVLEKIKDIAEDVYVRSEKRAEIVKQNIKGKTVTKHENLYRRKDGSHFIGYLILSTYRDVHGKTLHLEGMVEDITERKKAEEQLLKSKKLAEEASKYKSEFLANMSHELRTPLNSILGFCQIIDDFDLPENEMKGYVKLVYNSGKYLLDYINDVLDLSKIEAGKEEIKKEKFNVHDLLEEIVTLTQPLITSDKVIFDTMVEEKCSTKIYTDYMKLKQILINLVNNAAKFTEEGYIKVNVKKFPIVRYYDEDKTFIHFQISDTGCGIPKEKCKSIFDQYVQVNGSDRKKYKGTGLGLAISKKLVELLGGKIWFDTGVQGTSFHFIVETKPV